MTTTDLVISNSLADLAARIKAEHEACTAAMQRSLQHAIAAGELLIEAKRQLKHGEWLPWLRDHCAMPERTARLYMRLASNRELIEQQIGNGVADLSVRGAVALIAAPKKFSPIVALAHNAADTLVDELDLVAFEEAEAERDIRREAYAAIDAALVKLIAIGETPSNVAAHDLLGEQLVSAITEGKDLLLADLDELFAPSRDATTAILRAKDLAAEMLKRAELGDAA
jgi:Protein of unknown function (DUF3102)